MFIRYWKWLSRSRALCIWAVLLAGAAAFAEGLALMALSPLLDSLSAGAGIPDNVPLLSGETLASGVELLSTTLFVFVFLAAVAALVRALSEVLGLRIKSRVETDLREQMTDALLSMEWTAFTKLRQGDIAKAMVLEGMQVATGAMYMISALGAVLAAIGYLLISVIISAQLTLIAVSFGFIGALIYSVGSRAVRRHADQLSALAGDIGDRSAELFGYLKYFRATGQESILRRRASHLFRAYGRVYVISHLFSPALTAVVEILAALFIAGFLYLQLSTSPGSISQILIFLAVFYRLIPRLVNAQSYIFQATSYLAWLDTYDERLSAATSATLIQWGHRDPVFDKDIRLCNISHRFSDRDGLVLRNVTLTVGKGQFVAFVGPSGGGKTTVTDVIIGLTRPTEGFVEIDGRDLRTLSEVAWRSRIGLVMQEPMMLHASVAENVSMLRDGFEMERVEAALRRADAWDFVQRLPYGANTLVADRGARLSGGQRQRIAIARALYGNPELLILDEATSALDGHSEARIQATLDELRSETTIIVVAHRLKTVTSADVIYVLADGEVCESGSWNELISLKGMLFEMARQQGMFDSSQSSGALHAHS